MFNHQTAKEIEDFYKAMKVFLVVFACAIFNQVDSTGFIDDTRVEDCSSGTCTDICYFEGLSMLPGTEITNDGNCRRVRCNQDFSVQVTL